MKHSKWYPITVDAADTISASLHDAHSELQWIGVMTLNQKLLFLRPAAIPRIRLLDEAADEPQDDWVDADCAEAMPAEIAAGLREYFSDDTERFENSSVELQGTIRDYIAQQSIDKDNYRALLFETRIHFVSGITHSCDADEKGLAELVFGLELDEQPSTLRLDSDGEELFFAARSIVMIDIPLAAYLEGQKALRMEDGLDDDDDETEAPSK
jgi:hypothetical protein